MSNFSEKEIAYCASKIIQDFPDGISTENLMFYLRIKMMPNGNDTLLLKDRSDDLFSQKVRNLKSHNTLQNLNLSEYKNRKFYPVELNKFKEELINFKKIYPDIIKKFKNF